MDRATLERKLEEVLSLEFHSTLKAQRLVEILAPILTDDQMRSVLAEVERGLL